MIEIEHLLVYSERYIKFEQRFLPQELYDQFNKKILFKIDMSKENAYSITPPNGLMVYGPPCNGKSILVRQFAQQTNLPYCIINRYNLLDKQNHTNESFSKLIIDARNYSPCVILIENIETIIPNRRKLSDSAEYVDVMSNLSLLSDCGKYGVYVFATTTCPNDVDPQLGMNGYLNELFYAPFPDKKGRLHILKNLLSNNPCVDNIDYDIIVKESENFTIGDIVTLVEEISLNAAYEKKQIDNEVIQMTLDSFRVPLTSLERKKYDEIHSFLESKNKRNHSRIIGFQER